MQDGTFLLVVAKKKAPIKGANSIDRKSTFLFLKDLPKKQRDQIAHYGPDDGKDTGLKNVSKCDVRQDAADHTPDKPTSVAEISFHGYHAY